MNISGTKFDLNVKKYSKLTAFNGNKARKLFTLAYKIMSF